MLIRKAQSGDIHALQNAAWRVIRHNYTPFLGRDNISHFIDSGESDQETANGIEPCYDIQQDHTIIGYAIIKDDLLHLIMVDVPYQHKGCGTELLAYVEDEMFRYHSVIRLQSFEKNLDAVLFYENRGWSIKNEKYIAEMNMTMLHMEKSAW